MNILVFNCGSSSLNCRIFEIGTHENMKVILYGKAHRVGVKGKESSFVEYHINGNVQKDVRPIKDHGEAAALVLEYIRDHNLDIDYIGHRFVHGGSYFQDSVFLNEDRLKKLKLCLPLAPIHNPVSLSVIYRCQRYFPHIPQYVTFDSAFHSSIPNYAYTYVLPKRIIQRFGFRKYGFHGLSYSYVTRRASDFLNASQTRLRIVACHLGTGGSSVAAIKNGHSVDTSMGYSPLPGLVMSTRTGDIDPMLVIYLMSVYGYRSDDLEELINKRSGLWGISGFSSDIRDIIHRVSEEKEEQAELALNMYVHRLKKYIGSYVAALGGVDALVFTDDIGVHNPLVREKVCKNMKWCGVELDKKLNDEATGDRISSLSVDGADVAILSIPTEEELVIALEGIELLKQETR